MKKKKILSPEIRNLEKRIKKLEEKQETSLVRKKFGSTCSACNGWGDGTSPHTCSSCSACNGIIGAHVHSCGRRSY